MFSVKFAELFKTASGEIPENLFFIRVPKVQGATPRISQAKGRNVFLICLSFIFLELLIIDKQLYFFVRRNKNGTIYGVATWRSFNG